MISSGNSTIKNTSSIAVNKIYVNPNFKLSPSWSSVAQPMPHINPMFLLGHRANSIHMNPKFLQNQDHAIPMPHPGGAISHINTIDNSSKSVIYNENSVAKIIPKSRTKIVRRSTDNEQKSTILSKSNPGIVIENKDKLYRVSRYSLKRNTSYLTKRKLVTPKSTTKFQPNFNKKLLYITINGVLYKCNNNKLQRNDSTLKTVSVQCNIQKKDEKKLKPKCVNPLTKKVFSGRSLIVRGTKYIMDERGFKLTRLQSTQPVNMVKENVPSHEVLISKPKRIDIGGMTFVKSTVNDEYVRTHIHLALAHLSRTKHRSLMMLNKNLRKSNLPCPIYQRLGKCRAYERGRCNKTHHKQNVSICPRFLKDECKNANCLLSHDVSFSKMPVCIFYLQGICLRDNCPYLHKKLSSDAPVCEDFLRGYCKLAEKCEKRHEFQNENQKAQVNYVGDPKSQEGSNNEMKMKKILKSKTDKQTTEKEINPKTDIENKTYVRYFLGINKDSDKMEKRFETAASNDVDDVNNGEEEKLELPTENDKGNHETGNITIYRPTTRPKLPETLPAFIPLS